MSEDRWQLFALKPCEECQGTGETIIEKHNCDCPDCLGTGYEEPAKRIMNLERELAEARKQRDTLVEALSLLMHEDGGTRSLASCNPLCVNAMKALAAVKGGNHE